MLCLWPTVVTKNSLSSSSIGLDEGDGDAASGGVSYDQFTDVLNTALSAVTGGSALTLPAADADIVRQVAVLYRITELAVLAVGRGTSAARSLLSVSARCYRERFAANVATQHGLVSEHPRITGGVILYDIE